MTNRTQDALAALSLANFSLIVTWDGLVNYTSSQTVLLDHLPWRTQYAAAFLNVLLIGCLFYPLIRLARWMAVRYGTAGLLLASFPLLILAAAFPAKALVRLALNRIPDVGVTTAAGILAVALAGLALLARKRFLGVLSTVLVTTSPLIVVEAVLSILHCWTDHSAAFANGVLAPRQASPSVPRVVWIIFDDLDYRLTFLDRPANTPMPEFDRMRDHSFFADNAFSPASYTLLSVPSLIAGKVLSTIASPDLGTVLFDGTPAGAQSNIFSTTHALGANAAVVGWYLPYCRLFAKDLVSCSSHTIENELSQPDSTFSASLITQLRSLFAYGYRSALGSAPRARGRIVMINEMHGAAIKEAADPSVNLVFLHLPVPHSPYLYDRFSYTFPTRHLSFGSYQDNLALADNFLGDIRQAMTDAGLWDSTTVLVSSDHPIAEAPDVDGKSDKRVPFLLKMAGQKSGLRYEPPIATVLTKALLEDILGGKVATPEDAERWFAGRQTTSSLPWAR